MKNLAFDATCFRTGRSAVLRAVFAAIAVAAFSTGAVRTAAAQPVECAGPFRQCAIDVGGKCERTPAGKQKIVYYDYAGYVMAFERCVGRVLEAAGQPNPYMTVPAGTTGQRSRRPGGAKLSVPESELIYLDIDED